MLHTVNKSPFEKNSLETCLRLARKGSDVLLIEDAVVGALADTRLTPMIESARQRYRIYVLKEDLDARGIAAQDLLPGVVTIDYAGFVDLVVDNDSVQSWL